MGNRNAHPRAPRADIGLWRTAITRSTHRTGISVRLFGDRAGNVPETGTAPAKMGKNEGDVSETGKLPAVPLPSLPETVASHLQN